MRSFRFFLASVILVSSACAKTPYVYLPPGADKAPLECEAVQISRGEPISLLDGIGHYFFSLPAKLILWNWDVENHDIGTRTENALREYVVANNLGDVKFRLNEYSPGDEWSRLSSNTGMGAGWRYTLGALSVLFYTILPGRIFGGDNYNPYTNTVSLYSDVPAIALHEAGHAKDFALATHKGSYAALGLLPVVSLWFEKEATGDAIGYLRDKCYACAEKDAYKILYPAYGTYIGGEALDIVSILTPVNELIAIAAVIPGHIVGRIKASRIECPEECVDQGAEATVPEQDAERPF